MSRLAAASASLGIASVLTLCLGGGFAGLVAVFLGMLALERIRAANGQLRGRGFALTGIGLGFVGALAGLALQYAVGQAQSGMNADRDAGLKSTFAVAAADAPDEASNEALRSWLPASGTALDAGQIAAFSREAYARYGALESYSIQSEERYPSLAGPHRIVHAVAFEFERARVNGSMSVQITMGSGYVPRLGIESIGISDPERGDLWLPPRASAEAPEDSKAGESQSQEEAR